MIWTSAVLAIAIFATGITGSPHKKNKGILQRLGELEERLRKSDAEIERLKVGERQSVDKRQAQNDVAFSVFLNQLPTAVGPGEIIHYDKAITNEGNGYNTGTGMFTCSQPGLYLFSYTICQVHTDTLWADLYVNGVATAEAMTEPQHTNQDIQGTSTVVLRLKAGDLVWIAVRHGMEDAICRRTAIFTGVFLRS